MVFQSEIIVNVLVSSFRFIWIPILWVYGQYNFFNSFSAEIVFKRQNLTSVDVRFCKKMKPVRHPTKFPLFQLVYVKSSIGQWTIVIYHWDFIVTSAGDYTARLLFSMYLLRFLLMSIVALDYNSRHINNLAACIPCWDYSRVPMKISQ